MDGYHFVAIVGVARIERKKGRLAFLVQDPLGNMSYKTITLRLLRVMRSDSLIYVRLRPDHNAQRQRRLQYSSDDVVMAGGLKMKNLDDPQGTARPLSKEEWQIQQKELREAWNVLYNPDWVPERLRNKGSN